MKIPVIFPKIPTEFLKQVFSDNGQPSSSRILTTFHSLAAVFCLIYVTLTTRALPDGTILAGLGAFVTAPYAVNRVSNMFGKNGNSQQPELSIKSGA